MVYLRVASSTLWLVVSDIIIKLDRHWNRSRLSDSTTVRIGSPVDVPFCVLKVGPSFGIVLSFFFQSLLMWVSVLERKRGDFLACRGYSYHLAVCIPPLRYSLYPGVTSQSFKSSFAPSQSNIIGREATVYYNESVNLSQRLECVPESFAHRTQNSYESASRNYVFLCV